MEFLFILAVISGIAGAYAHAKEEIAKSLAGVAIAVALIHNPRLLLLDEPTLGLDVEASEMVKALVRQIAQEGLGVQADG